MKRTNLSSLMCLYSRGYVKAKELLIEKEVMQGVNFDSVEVTRSTIFDCNLTLINFTNCYFCGIKFYRTKFYNVTFTNCKFEDCYIFSTFLEKVTCNYSTFKNSRFVLSSIDSCNFNTINFNESFIDKTLINKIRLHSSKMDYSGVYDSEAKFSKIQYCTFSNFHQDNFILSRSSLTENIFANTDLSFLSEGNINFRGIQRVDYLSVVKTINDPDLSLILSKCGIPNLSSIYMIDSIRALDTNIIRKLMQSVFISYGGSDHFFASILNMALKKDGINTYFFPENSIPGQKLHRVMRSELRKYDRVIFICSETSLVRAGVLNELENVLSKEAELGGEDILIPITLDEFVLENWRPKNLDYAVAIRERVITKFDASYPESNPNMDSTIYKNALYKKLRKTIPYKKLLVALTSEVVSSLE